MRRRGRAVMVAGTAVLLAGCQTAGLLTQGAAGLGVATGKLTPQQAEALTKTAEATGRALEKFTPEQEYYLGRAVVATVLTQYRPLEDRRLNEYVNLVGQTLAAFSDKPETFGGYHFLVLDTDEVNAIAAPGGLILVSRGLLECCPDEEALAAVLAHEIAHVQLEHGMKAIESSRWKSAGMTAALEAGKTLAGKELAEVLSTFEDCIQDITSRILNAGYARKQEYAADRAAVEILRRAGYDPRGLRTMLEEMAQRVKAADVRGFGKTHPHPSERLTELEPLLRLLPDEVVGRTERTARFRKQMVRR